MSVNRGKQFEQVVRECFSTVRDVLVIRLPDQTSGYAGSTNMCDFLVYRKPLLYCIECKSVHGNTLSFYNISKNQWTSLEKAGRKKGVVAGILCWWIDKDVTKFIPISALAAIKETGKYKSYNYAWEDSSEGVVSLVGKKKRVFFEYDMKQFFESVERMHK